MKIDNSDYFSKLAVFSNYSFKKIENEFPDYLETAMESWLYSFHLSQHEFNEQEEKYANQKAAHTANIIVDNFYNQLVSESSFYKNTQKDNLKEASNNDLKKNSNKTWDEELAGAEYPNNFSNTKNANQKNTQKRRSKNSRCCIS